VDSAPTPRFPCHDSKEPIRPAGLVQESESCPEAAADCVSALYFFIGFQVSLKQSCILAILGMGKCIDRAGIAMLESEMPAPIVQAWQLAVMFHPLPETASRLHA
jgi:hypothetical protein